MTAFDDFLEKSSKAQFDEDRKNLVSNRGSFSSGCLPENMDLAMDMRGTLFADERRVPGKIFIRKAGSRSEDFGFVFDVHGTEKIISRIVSGSPLKIFDDLRDDFLFKEEAKKETWLNTGDVVKKRLIAEDIRQMMKKTDIQYRTHGDRLHYLVIGKIETTERTARSIEKKVYPLALFSCYETDQKRLMVEVEQSGFLNFWLDEKILDGELTKNFGGVEVEINSELSTKLVSLEQKLKKLNIMTVDEIKFDPTFSMVGIVSGFEAEYVDLAWKEILK